MKQCPIASKIAGLIEILPCCVLNDFFTSIEVWTFANNRVYMYHVFHWLSKEKKKKKKKSVTAPILKPAYDQKPETFLFWPGLK